jgi:hypothetical protein
MSELNSAPTIANFKEPMLNEVSTQRDSDVPQKGRGYAVASGILGWTLDAFDFFVVVFLVDTLATHFRGRQPTPTLEPPGDGRSALLSNDGT